MTRELLLEHICHTDCTDDCVVLGSCACDDCYVKLNELLDKYDKQIIEQYKANINLKDTIKDIHDSVANEMYRKGIDDLCKAISVYGTYDEYGNVIDILEIAQRLKEQN